MKSWNLIKSAFVTNTLFWLLILLPQCAEATHLRAGNITVIQTGGLSVRVKVLIYVAIGETDVRVGGRGEFLDFGDGNRIEIPELDATPVPGYINVGVVEFERSHTYLAPGSYIIFWQEPNRNEGVLNVANSVNTQFYIETQFTISPFFGENRSPVLLVPPIDKACSGVAFQHNPGAYDPDGDSLSYELVIPFQGNALPVGGYLAPNSQAFYNTIPYNQANEDGDGPPLFSINDSTGTLTLNAPGDVGLPTNGGVEYNIAFIVREWKKIFGVWTPIGFVRRDMQIIVEECDNERPDIIIPADTCIEAGTLLTAVITGFDPNDSPQHPVRIEAFSEIFISGAVSDPVATFSAPSDFSPSPVNGTFTWQTDCEHVKDQSYQVVFKVTDDPPNGPSLVTFKTWTITVVGPKPQWNTATSVGRRAELEWQPYICENADSIQIWRRVGSILYDPPNCETGMPSFLGYTKIGQVANRDATNQPITTFEDTNGGAGLDVGAVYCYRLVAVFSEPRGGESYVSDEICLDPIEGLAPIITEVTVLQTGINDGEIRVSWRNPIDYDRVKYPGPFLYEVKRAKGFTGETEREKIHTGFLSGDVDTTELDLNIDTQTEIYNYRVVLWSNTNIDPTYQRVDSVVASAVRLEAQSQIKKINLTWNAFTPWSNFDLNNPRHLIYRGLKDQPLELIDSINVTQFGFTYLDSGRYQNTPLVDDQQYCYRVLTRGTYGNPAIHDPTEPLENFSQIICAQPSDTIPPCKLLPPVAVNAPDCRSEDVVDLCSRKVFENVISWLAPADDECRDQISFYRVYASATDHSVYSLIADRIRPTTGTITYTHSNLPSNAQCYRISAVDRSGNESELSDPICIDNCPYFEMPNVFTPNGDGCNDKFSAYSDSLRYYVSNGEELVPICPGENSTIRVEDLPRCARFVRKVSFKVFNRWGKELYDYESGGENTIYIDWNGRDSNGRDLASGIYYWAAEVEFEASTESQRVQLYKGWVHLLR